MTRRSLFKRIRFEKPPICEECGLNRATVFDFFWDGAAGVPGRWVFCCGKCLIFGRCHRIPIAQFFDSPASTVAWLARLHGRGWGDWNNFMEMICRFRASTGSSIKPKPNSP